MTRPAVYVEGAALEISFADGRRNLQELIFDTVRAAVDDSGQPMHEIDSVVLAAHDLVDGRSLSSMVTSPAAGAYLRDEIRLSEDGLAALSLAAAQIESGTFERVLVAAWGRPAEGDPELASARAFDPFTTQPFGLTDLTVAALRASAYLRRHGTGSGPEADKQREVLKRLTYGGFKPADDSYLDPIREMNAFQAVADAKKSGDPARVTRAQKALDEIRVKASQRRAVNPDAG